MYLDRTLVDDIAFYPYRGHYETRQLDIISLYSGWMTCGLALIYLYLPERVMRQFVYLQIILRHPSEFVPPTIHCRDLDVIFDDFKSHLILVEYRMVLAHVHWAHADDYIHGSIDITTNNVFMTKLSPRTIENRDIKPRNAIFYYLKNKKKHTFPWFFIIPR